MSNIVYSVADVLGDLHTLQESSTFTDVCFLCSDGKVSAHKAALARHSALFQETFRRRRGCCCADGQCSDLEEAATFILPDISVDRVRELISLLYTGQTLVNSAEDLASLDALCKALGVKIPLKVSRNVVLFRPKLLSTTKKSAVPDQSGSNRKRKKSEEKVSEEIFECVECDRVFQTKSGKNKHMKLKHPSDLENGDGSDVVDPLNFLSTEGKYEQESDVEVDVTGTDMDDPDLDDEEPLAGWKDKEVKKPKIMRQSGSGFGSECPDCSKVFPTLGRIREHLATTHLNDSLMSYVGENNTCTVCSYTSNTVKNVARHAGLVHAGVEEFADERQLAWIEAFKGGKM